MLFCVLVVLLHMPMFASAQTAPENAGEVFDKIQEKKSDMDVSVAPVTVTPVVANEKAKPRDIIKKELLITNNTGQRIDLYITVENIDPTDGIQEFVPPSTSDLSMSLANWIEITRGVIELSSGESRKIPYLIHVNLTAKPGSYFARVQFHEGARRSEATAKDDGVSLMLNVEVLDDAKERLQLGNFRTDDSVVLGDTVSFSYLLKNVGNRLLEPRGSIRIFNRRGEEVGSVPLNADGDEISPENKRQLAAAWSAAGRFGKYKAFLDLEYGENQLASVQDTVYFWIFPWQEIVTTLIGVLVLAVIGTLIIHTRAVARPVQVQDRAPQQNPTYTAARTTSNPAPVHRGASDHGQTVLAARPSRARAATPAPQHTPGAAHHGSTIELSARGARSSSRYGNTVELPRRS